MPTKGMVQLADHSAGEYYILQQILSKELHRVDKEAEAYAISLMTKLEDIKAQHAEDDTITDDLAAQAYIEQFATETFQRAENAVAANNASAYAILRRFFFYTAHQVTKMATDKR